MPAPGEVVGLSSLEKTAYLRSLLMSGPKVGKAQPIDEPVLTPNGWRRIGDLTVGDTVIGSTGTPVTVTGVFPQGIRKVVRVTTDTGCWTRCSEEHLWLTATKNELRKGVRTGKLRNVVECGTAKMAAEIAAWLESADSLSEGDRTHYLPELSGAVQFSDSKALNFDPYFIGILVGDGSFTAGSNVTLTSKDEELLLATVAGAIRIGDTGKIKRSSEHCPYVRITGPNTRALLRQLELWNCRSHEKFVPGVLFHSTPEDRLAFLQGLFDTDGYAHPNGTQIEYSSTSEVLATGVVELIRSLGGWATIQSKIPTCQTGPARMAWVVDAGLPSNPFRLNRKAAIRKADREREWRPRLLSVTPDGEAKCVCIRVDAPDSLYVTRNWILTHNSTVAIKTLPWPIRYILAEDDSALQYGYVELQDQGLTTAEIDERVSITTVDSYNTMLKIIERARQDIAAGLVASIVVDPVSAYDKMVLDHCEKTITHGQAAHKKCSDQLRHVVIQLKRLPAHIVFISQYSSIPGGATSAGEGKVPNMANNRNCVFLGAELHQILWLESDEQGKRHFLTSAKGAWGPGVRGLKGVDKMPADFGQLIDKLGMRAGLSLEQVAQRAANAALDSEPAGVSSESDADSDDDTDAPASPPVVKPSIAVKTAQTVKK